MFLLLCTTLFIKRFTKDDNPRRGLLQQSVGRAGTGTATMRLVHTLLLLALLRIQEGGMQTWFDMQKSGDCPSYLADYQGLCCSTKTTESSIYCKRRSGNGLQCLSCVGSNDEDCNKQGSQQCPRDSDACAIIRGQSNGVMKSCSFKSFCDRALRDGAKASGVSVRCCFSNNCNSVSQGSSFHMSASYFCILVALTFGFCILIIS